MEQITIELTQTIENIKLEIQKAKSFKTIKVKSCNIDLSSLPICSKILTTIASELDMNIKHKLSFEDHMTIVVSFKDNLEKTYEFTISMDENMSEPTFLLEICYISLEHRSLNCNWNREWIGTLVLNPPDQERSEKLNLGEIRSGSHPQQNGRSMEEILNWIKGLRGKPRTTHCHYCGEINFEQ